MRALLEAAREFRERARKPEVIEELWAQLLREAADVVEAGLHDLLCLGQLRALLRARVGGQSLELEQYGGHRLPDLIVQAAGEPLSLLFLRLQGVRTGVPAFFLQPLEHPVEGSFERADLATLSTGRRWPPRRTSAASIRSASRRAAGTDAAGEDR